MLKNRGMLIEGRAGTGKSHVVKMISKLFGRVKRLAPTNKAALNIKGSTIHKFLKMDKDGLISRHWLDVIKDKYDYIVIDEMSMITAEIWKRLVELKRSTEITFILVGDFRQCAPVEDKNIEDYFNHPAVKYLANYAKVKLTVPHRYDDQLWQLLEDVNEVNPAEFKSNVCKKNMCFYNVTRQYVNDLLMKQNKPEDAKFIEKDASDDYTQDVWLYKGLQIIARVTQGEGDMTVNNESFEVVEVYESEFVCKSIRANDEGEPIEHLLHFPYENFHKCFAVNYCSTTHKSQGDTITEDFTIWDWNRMSKKLRYTAMSRAKKPE